MKEFRMIFRHTPVDDFQMSPEQMQTSIKHWQDWIGGIAAQGKFIVTNHLGFEGKFLKPDNVITDGPYAEVKEIVGGYISVKANSLDNALSLAEGCPVLFHGGHVERRDIMKRN